MTSVRRKANFAPLSPVSFLLRGATFFADRPAIIYGEEQFTYGEFCSRVKRLAAALKATGIAMGDRVAILAPNTPPMLEAHYAIPMLGAVLAPLNLSLDAETVGFLLNHSDARLLICDREYLDLARQALEQAGRDLPVIVINDPAAGLPVEQGMTDYGAFIRDASDAADLEVEDEHQPISLLYTSGTTGTPKGVVYSHRGAYLASLSNALSFGLNHNSVYLWTWPMFHCNGLTFTWAVTAVGATHVCLRKFDAAVIFDFIKRHCVTHFSAAPTVMNMLVNDPRADDVSFEHRVQCATGGAPPPSFVINSMQKLGIEVTHQYGSTECYGPATIALRRPEWDQMTNEDRSEIMTRQGTPTPVIDGLIVADPATMQPITRDGQSLGEVMLRGNTIMQGYFGDDDASSEAMAGGWFHSGDIAVWHPDGSIEIKDRSTDIIKSGDEIVSSVEIEDVLFEHADVLEAAVVAKPDQILGEIPCAFIVPVAGAELSARGLTEYCRSILADFKVPKQFIFCDLPKTATGKIKKRELRELAKRADLPE